ncbi:MAG TPA: hypothetical protein VES92_05080 [Nitrospiraceae bacterium]|nr:hypothetical protein [Nitrospiraceae bacterium]
MMDDARTEEKMKRLKRGSQMSGHSRLFVRARIIALAVTVLSVVTVGVTPADDQPLPSMTIAYQNGTITAIYEKTLDIDGRTYGLMPDVVMLDEHGDMLDPARLMVTAEVKFHVKKEQSNMIDKMIVTLPR